MSTHSFKKFSPNIQSWYHIHKRNLPWRSTSNPYFIWLSEIILQQTRVNQGLAYYSAFTEAFPTVNDLANAEEDKVLRLWQGLGYYSRARNLHTTAKIIVEKYNGVFPNSFDTIINLKGIGPYTAAAIASFAFDLPHAVVDGNVFRVIARYAGIDTPIDSTEGKKLFQNLATELLDRDEPALHNQAIMEFGALLCTPKKPNCSSCPLAESCAALHSNRVDVLPVKSKKTKVTHRYFTYFIPTVGPFTFLRKRNAGEIWEGLWEFPLIETKEKTDAFSEIYPKNFPMETWMDTGYEKVHKLSHQHLHCRFLIGSSSDLNHQISDFKKLHINELKDYAMPALLQQFVEQYIIPLHLEERK